MTAFSSSSSSSIHASSLLKASSNKLTKASFASYSQRTKVFLSQQWMGICLGLLMGVVMTSRNYSLYDSTVRGIVSSSSSGIQMSLEEFITINERLITKRTSSHDNELVTKNCECGCWDSEIKSCPRQYDLNDVDTSANVLLTKEISDYLSLLLTQRRRKSQIECLEDSSLGAITQTQQQTSSGGYCLNSHDEKTDTAGSINIPNGFITLPFPKRLLPIPKGHIEASPGMKKALNSFIIKQKITSISDFGGGIGQYGTYIEKNFPDSLLYHGYDGAGDVEVYTQGYLKFFDLSIPLNLPVTEWVMSLEVGEHIPNALEGVVIRNLHAHNCKGIILSWAVEGQNGRGHINNHNNEYLIDIFEELGYTFEKEEANVFRDAVPSRPSRGGAGNGWWFHESLMIFKRKVPLC